MGSICVYKYVLLNVLLNYSFRIFALIFIDFSSCPPKLNVLYGGVPHLEGGGSPQCLHLENIFIILFKLQEH